VAFNAVGWENAARFIYISIPEISGRMEDRARPHLGRGVVYPSQWFRVLDHFISNNMLRIRPATVGDVPLLREMIVEFATFERLIDELRITEEILVRDGFGPEPRFRALVAEWAGKPAGYAMYFHCYSSFQGPVLFLEDVYVRQELRAKGIGIALMAQVASIAQRQGLRVMRWEVLDWNQPAIDFYKKIGATFMDECKEMWLEDEALRRLAERAKP
jgi:GNAT superfamily N-acetyltransferase